MIGDLAEGLSEIGDFMPLSSEFPSQANVSGGPGFLTGEPNS
jgi:hypothetical protein